MGNLLRLYTEWHSRLLPYYSFNQFVHKVEKVAATRRVKVLFISSNCISLCTCSVIDFGIVNFEKKNVVKKLN